MSIQAHIATIRFGFGTRLGEAPPGDPKAWLRQQLERPAPPPEGPSLADAMEVRAADFIARRANNPVGDPQETRRALAATIRQESEGFVRLRLLGSQPFRERLVDFWMNHFTVSARGAATNVLLGSFEREAIRPHVTGRFADMVVAVAKHPAMLVYLDNVNSVGPASPAGRRRRVGLNENLAREMLELHTLSPAGGYTQGDVQELAKILTGWSFHTLTEPHPRGFVFRAAAHEPGEKFLLGRRFGPGEAQGEAALRLLAEHPATWRHLATKLARHFVADDPPPAAVSRLHLVLRDTEGDLGAVARALIDLPQAWDPPLSKFRPPIDYLLAAGRALGLAENQANLLLRGFSGLSQRLWSAPQPNGWPDRAEEWATPEALMRQVDWAYTLAGRAGRVEAAEVVEAALGPLARAETVAAMRGAGSVRDALTLMLGSPEFMRR